MSKFVVVKPRGEKRIVETPKQTISYDTKKITSYETFIQQQVGRKPVKRILGDYVIWIADTSLRIVDGYDDFTIGTRTSLTPNLMLNGAEIAYGGVVFTANRRASTYTSDYEGLLDIDEASIINAFTRTQSLVVLDDMTGKNVAVDNSTDAVFSPKGYVPTSPVIPKPVIPTFNDGLEDLSK